MYHMYIDHFGILIIADKASLDHWLMQYSMQTMQQESSSF